MRGREGKGRHAQRMTRPRKPGCGRLQRGGGGWGAGVGKPSWLSEMTLSLTEGLPVSPTISGKTCPLITLPYFSTMPPRYALTLKVFISGGHPPALWPSPLPVSKALSVLSPRALMSRKGLFPMPMETICCTRSSREQRPCYQPPSAPLCSQP